MCTSMMKDSRFQVAVLSMLILSMTLASADSGPCETTPRFCQGLDCPKFSVVNTTHAYEVRDYDKSTWVATSAQGYFIPWAGGRATKKLIKYFRGDNEDNMKLNMTVPVVVNAGPECRPKWSWCKRNVTVAFFVPLDYQDDPPKPDDPDIKVLDAPEFTAYVAISRGWWPISCKAKSLRRALWYDGIDYYRSKVLYAFYTSPFRFHHRHKEVWAIKKKDDGDDDDDDSDYHGRMGIDSSIASF